MTRTLILFSLVLLEFSCSGQVNQKNESTSCEKCNNDVLVYTVKSESNLSKEDVYSFLCTLDIKCLNNVEFSEVSNELLFTVVTRYPGFFLESLSENSGVDRDFVLDQLSNPVSELVGLEEAAKAIESVQSNDALKQEVLVALRRS